jgi:spore germination protein KC
VGEVQCKIDLLDPESIKELEKTAQKEVKVVQDAAIQKAKKYNVDIFGFGEAINRADPKYWNKNKENWKEQFLDLPVHVKTEVKIRCRLLFINTRYITEHCPKFAYEDTKPFRFHHSCFSTI